MTSRGFQIVELVVTLAIAAFLATLLAPALFSASAGTRVRLAASEVVGVFHTARAAALREGVNVGVKFYPDAVGGPLFRLYRDGDGDGVRSDDLARGVDPPLGPYRPLARFDSTVGFGIPAGLAPRDPGQPRRALARLEDPIRFNRSDIASFGPTGTATPGSVYLSDGRRRLAVVRVLSRTGRIRVLVYDPEAAAWR